MPPRHLARNARFSSRALSLCLALSLVACSSTEGANVAAPPSGAGASSGGSSSGSSAGASASGGESVGGQPEAGAPGGGSSGAGRGGGGGIGGAAGGGTGGNAQGSGSAGGTAGTGGLEPGDTPPWRPLDVFAAPGEHKHGNAGVDTRAKLLGKLVVDIGVNSGGYSQWLAKRGYHSMGAPCGSCPAPNLGAGRDEVGNCRLEEFATTEASVKSTLSTLHAQFPEEDWGYFLNQDGSVRWSDVAITGISHGATTSAIAGRLGARMWRVVSRSGPRDNTCGMGNGQCTLPITNPSYDVDCPDEEVASWLDQPSKTPMNRFFGIVGTTDGQCGDIMFNMMRTGYIGAPTIFNQGDPDLSGTNQFFSTEGGHYDFLAAPGGVNNTEAVLNIAFGIPPENQNPDF